MSRILCVDVGNSRVKLALAGAGKLGRVWAVETDRVRSNPGRLWPPSPRLESTAGSIVSSVVPALNPLLARVLRHKLGHKPMFVDHTRHLPFGLRVADPSALGVDRICAAAGVIVGRRRSAIVIDIGSAITVDLVGDGVFHGGPIMIGPALGLRALGQFAARLPKISPARPRRDLARSTAASMRLGAELAAVGAIVQAVRYLERRHRRRPRKFVTGGGLRLIRHRLPKSWEARPDLVHEGLVRLWELNGPQTTRP